MPGGLLQNRDGISCPGRLRHSLLPDTTSRRDGCFLQALAQKKQDKEEPWIPLLGAGLSDADPARSGEAPAPRRRVQR